MPSPLYQIPPYIPLYYFILLGKAIHVTVREGP
jgi:hypothetical protein